MLANNEVGTIQVGLRAVFIQVYHVRHGRLLA